MPCWETTAKKGVTLLLLCGDQPLPLFVPLTKQSHGHGKGSFSISMLHFNVSKSIQLLVILHLTSENNALGICLLQWKINTPIRRDQHPYQISSIDGGPSGTGIVTQWTDPITLHVSTIHKENIIFCATNIPKHPFIQRPTLDAAPQSTKIIRRQGHNTKVRLLPSWVPIIPVLNIYQHLDWEPWHWFTCADPGGILRVQVFAKQELGPTSTLNISLSTRPWKALQQANWATHIPCISHILLWEENGMGSTHVLITGA